MPDVRFVEPCIAHQETGAFLIRSDLGRRDSDGVLRRGLRHAGCQGARNAVEPHDEMKAGLRAVDLDCRAERSLQCRQQRVAATLVAPARAADMALEMPVADEMRKDRLLE